MSAWAWYAWYIMGRQFFGRWGGDTLDNRRQGLVVPKPEVD